MDRCGVINAGPLIALSLAGRLDLLPRLFAESWIPDVVWREVTGADIWRPGAVTLADSVHQRHVREAPEPDPLLLAELESRRSRGDFARTRMSALHGDHR